MFPHTPWSPAFISCRSIDSSSSVQSQSWPQTAANAPTSAEPPGERESARRDELIAALVIAVEALVRHTGCSVEWPRWQPVHMHDWLT